MRTVGYTLAFGVIAFVAMTIALSLVMSGQTAMRVVPACQEDSVLIGNGQFTNGYWSRYECGPAVDDYIVVEGN